MPNNMLGEPRFFTQAEQEKTKEVVRDMYATLGEEIEFLRALLKITPIPKDSIELRIQFLKQFRTNLWE